MVRLEGVSLTYGTARERSRDAHPARLAAAAPGEVLRGVSFSVQQGGFRWLLGPSGAGKSSLLRLLYLAARPTQGSLALLGQEVARRDGWRAERRALPRLRRRIGVVYQDFRLLPHLSAFDNVALPLRLAGRPESQLLLDVADMLAWVGLSSRQAARPAQLSGGEQQRVAIARAVIARPGLLLADEPTGNLDDAQAERLMQLLVELGRLGTTIIVATHNEALVERHPARSLRLHQGRLVADV